MQETPFIAGTLEHDITLLDHDKDFDPIEKYFNMKKIL
jgi:hypothetical protein